MSPCNMEPVKKISYKQYYQLISSMKPFTVPPLHYYNIAIKHKKNNVIYSTLCKIKDNLHFCL